MELVKKGEIVEVLENGEIVKLQTNISLFSYEIKEDYNHKKKQF